MQQSSKQLTYLGIQSAARKRRRLGQNTGNAWAGFFIGTNDKNQVVASVPKDKWVKMKKHLEWLEGATKQGMIEFKKLERMRGFAIHVSRTYTQLIPYLKGVRQTLDQCAHGVDRMGGNYLHKKYRH